MFMEGVVREREEAIREVAKVSQLHPVLPQRLHMYMPHQ